MTPTRAKKGASILIGLALALALPGAALAASQSSTAAESLTVGSQVSVTNVPTSLAYGSTIGGATLSANLNVEMSTNHPTGVTLTLDASALSRTGGGGSIPSTNRLFTFTRNNSPFPSGISDTHVNGSEWSYTGSPTAIASSSGPIGPANYAVVSKIFIPADAVPGDYAGTLTFTVATN